ncbi:MAG TPA: hypothetical protein PKE06_23760, partial [Flavilitoribacter sp.]|nr:hypothetical protein [Flavilitoribacter sp.]
MRFIAYTSFHILLVFSVSAGFSGCQGTRSQGPVLPDPNPAHQEAGLDYQGFLNPPDAYRSHPFYSLNDRLEKDELRRQIKDFKQAGFGGFYLQTRARVITEYLGAEWWEKMDAGRDARQERGL